jgi:3-oxoacyl-[acyl-carrier protein] reductase
MNIRFDGKIVAVSGAGHGIGRAISVSFAQMGARVFGCDIREEALAGTAAEAAGIETKVVDLRDRAAAAAWIREIEQKAGTGVDILVTSAGGVAGQVFQPVENVADEQWDAVFDVNVHATFVLSRAVAPGMKRKGGGRIVTISSGAGLQPSLTGIQAYCSSKHAIVGLTRQLAHELGEFGITVNSVAPGFIRSNPSSEKQWESYGEAGQKALVERIALKRLGTAQDIANGVIFFASDLGSFVTGQILQVDGGK